MKKRVARGLCPAFSFPSHVPFISVWEYAAPARVSRPERSDRVSEEVQYHRPIIILPTPRSRIFPLPNKAVNVPITTVLT